MLRIVTALLFIALLAPATLYAQNVVELQAVKDNTLYEDSGGNFSNGSGQHIFAGTTQRDNLIRRALVAFDLDGALPDGAIVDSVQVELHMNRSLGTRHFAHLHRVTRDWGEGSSDSVGQEGGGANAVDGDATWIHAIRPGTTWTNPGGDFRSANSAEISILDQGPAIWYNTSDLLTDVNDWLADPASNFGWLVMGDELTSGTAQRFASRENPDSNDHPTLRIYYTVTATYVEESTKPSSLSLSGAWPNPFQDKTTVSIDSDQAGSVQFEVIDMQGRIVHSSSTWTPPGTTDLKLDGSSWAPGLYLVRISGPQGSATRTLIRAR